MAAAPYFVFALTAGLLGKIAGNDMGKLIEIFKALGGYSLTVVFGLGIMLFGVYPLLMSIMLKRPVFIAFFRAMGPAQLLAFSSSSSAATLPVTMDCVSNRLKVPKYISGFVLPIGATVNMDGTSLYQAVAVVFLAQFHMIDLSTAQQLTITSMAMMASVGAAAVPGAGLIMLIVVLTSVGLNPAWIAIILPVDRILDMCRTVINVTGDATVSYIIAGTEHKKEQPKVVLD
jgi:Na+/H+-dicarboxylate symporter